MVKKLFTSIKKLPLDILAREFFYFFACLLMTLAILEVIFPNTVLAYFNLNYLVVLIIVSGLVALINNRK